MDLYDLFEANTVVSKKRDLPRAIMMSRRCQKEAAEFGKSFPDFKKIFLDFVNVKISHDPPVLFGKKDGPLGGSSNAVFDQRYWHAHIIFGKAIIIYRIDRDNLYLYRVTDHLAVEGSGIKQLARSLNDPEWTSIQAPSSEPQLSPEQEELAKDLFQTMREHPDDYNVLRTFALGKSTRIQDYTEMVGLENANVDALRVVAKKFI